MIRRSSLLVLSCAVYAYASNILCGAETVSAAPTKLADASTTASDASASTHSTPLLRSGAEDTEKMQRSVKLLIPAPLPPPAPPSPPVVAPPRQFQAGAQQSQQPYRNPYSAGIARPAPSGTPWTFQLDALQRFQPMPPPRAPVLPHPYGVPVGVPMQGPGRIWSGYPGSTTAPGGIWAPGGLPTRVTTARPRQTFTIQTDPWTNVSSVEPFRAAQLANLQTAIKRLHSGESLVPKVAIAGQLQLPAQKASGQRAAQMALPLPPAPKTWDEWYKKVANALYDRWKQNTAGPGTAIVLITVFDSRYVDCRVTEFDPAVGADRDVDGESRFKQVALQCVTSLSGDVVWQFPATAPVPKHIVFDMEFKHVVGEDAGCKVVHLHTGQTLDAADDKK